MSVSLILTGPSPPDSSSGAIQVTLGSTLGPFTVQPNQPYTGVVTMSDGKPFISAANVLCDPMVLPSGTFTPSQLVFNNSMVAQTFTYTPNQLGYKPISISGSNGASASAVVYVFVNGPGYYP